MEQNNSLPFLDMLAIDCPDGSLQFDWYTKPTSSGRLVNYFSNHPLTQKLNVIDNLIRRVFSTSSAPFSTKNRKIVKDILLNNNYPEKLIEKRIKKYFCSQNSTTSNQNNNNNNTNNNTTTISNTINQCNNSGTPTQNPVEIQYILFDPACTCQN